MRSVESSCITDKAFQGGEDVDQHGVVSALDEDLLDPRSLAERFDSLAKRNIVVGQTCSSAVGSGRADVPRRCCHGVTADTDCRRGYSLDLE